MGNRDKLDAEIDWNKFEALCQLQCALPEVAVAFGCREEIIEQLVLRHYRKDFDEVFGQLRVKSILKLRQNVWARATEGNTRLLIFLFKEYLSKSDHASPPPKEEPKPDFSRLTEEQLKCLDELIQFARPRKSPKGELDLRRLTDEQLAMMDHLITIAENPGSTCAEPKDAVGELAPSDEAGHPAARGGDVPSASAESNSTALGHTGQPMTDAPVEPGSMASGNPLGPSKEP